ncbi:IMPACT family protein [Simiduia agarivorans]|uniref:YigZ family protein n=1 Tax=Simiduia agarivorans (strain DSM 21679 / JCM 13881 / BCRC 17597 / SA1) TaxID=1117647 RepID=K4KKI2_SIMAS|nr:YigZ family protein [Simiduia agarivorans]AFU98553.1 hypothetical protein M5M_06790 [Simiduia agarivorans SA1 = DSM 21679]
MTEPTINGAYAVAAGRAEAETEVRKSRFIAWADRAQTREQAMALLADAKARYPDARHHCWAYLLGPGLTPASQAFSDDGEPGGTAGKPMLNVLSHKGIGDIAVVVIRYFGGIKLGAGGLVRAYSQATQAVIDQLETTMITPVSHYTVIADYAAEQWLRHWLGQHQGELVAVEYADQVTYRLALPQQFFADLQAPLAASGWSLLPDESDKKC